MPYPKVETLEQYTIIKAERDLILKHVKETGQISKALYEWYRWSGESTFGYQLSHGIENTHWEDLDYLRSVVNRQWPYVYQYEAA